MGRLGEKAPCRIAGGVLFFNYLQKKRSDLLLDFKSQPIRRAPATYVRPGLAGLVQHHHIALIDCVLNFPHRYLVPARGQGKKRSLLAHTGRQLHLHRQMASARDARAGGVQHSNFRSPLVGEGSRA